MNKNNLLALPLPEDHELSAETATFLKAMPSLNIFRMMAYIPDSLTAFIQLAKSLLDKSSLSFRIREIAILRVGYLTRSAYEWHQHALLAKSAGLTDQEIEILRTQNPVHSLTQEENFISKVVDELILTNSLSDDTFKQLFATYSKKTGCELVMIIGFYNMIAGFLAGTRVQIEDTNPLEGRSSPT